MAAHLGGVGGVGGGQHRGGEDVGLRGAEGDAGIGQVGVDLEVAVAGVLGGAAGGGHPGAHQGDHQVAGQVPGAGLGGHDDFGHRHRPGRLPHPDPRRGGQPEPAVRGVVQGPRVHRGVDRAILPVGVVVHQAEAAAHHGVADLADRQRTGHRARPTQSDQTVGAGELVDVGAAVHPVDAVPQRQRLGVAQHLPDGAAHLDPFTEGASVALHRGRRGRGASHRARGQQMPRPLAGLGMGRMFGVDGEFVARTAGGNPLPAGGVLHQGDDGTAAGRVDTQSVKLVGDRRSFDGLPPTRLRTRGDPVGPPAQ